MNARTVLLLLFVVISCIAIPVVSLNYLTPPYFWIGCGYIVIALLLFFFVTSSRSKAVVVNLIVIISTLSAFEWYLYSNREYKKGRIENLYDGKYKLFHPDLGYTLDANLTRPNVKKFLDDKLIYQVSYSTNKYGLRKSMGENRADNVNGCILLYGGSYTYGEGLNNEESLPWQIDVLTGHRFRVYNFGLHGYGPHQMLASLEKGHTSSIVDCKNEPVVVIYQAMFVHPRRAQGLTFWDRQGPRYLVNAQGKAVYTGRFDESITRGKLFHLLDASYIYKAALGSSRLLREEDYDLFLAILEKAREKSKELFDLQSFVVLYWDRGSNDPLVEKMNNHGFRVYRVNDLIPGARSSDSEYRLSEDGHPSTLANKEIAAFIVEQGLVPQRKSDAERYEIHPARTLHGDADKGGESANAGTE